MDSLYTVKIVNNKTEWFLNGKLHRENGPAREHSNGDKSWWLKGKRHRENGPAIEFADGASLWFKKGKAHRIDGPACTYSNRHGIFYINNIEISKEDFNSWIKRIKRMEKFK